MALLEVLNLHTPPEILETDRLRIRRQRLSDAAGIFAGWAQDPIFTRYLHWEPHKSIDDSVAHVTRCEEAWESRSSFTWILEDPESGVFLGSVVAHPSGHRVGLGYGLARPAWGRGLMTEAVGEVTRWFLSQPGVFRVWAVCDFENQASARVLERSGFELEGTLRRWLTHPNASPEPRDALCYSIVRT